MRFRGTIFLHVGILGYWTYTTTAAAVIILWHGSILDLLIQESMVGDKAVLGLGSSGTVGGSQIAMVDC